MRRKTTVLSFYKLNNKTYDTIQPMTRPVTKRRTEFNKRYDAQCTSVSCSTSQGSRTFAVVRPLASHKCGSGLDLPQVDLTRIPGENVFWERNIIFRTRSRCASDEVARGRPSSASYLHGTAHETKDF